MQLRPFKTYVFVLFLYVSFPSFSQSDLVTDRPDQAESSSTVGHGVLQIETGALFESMDNEGGIQDNKFTSLFTTLFRLGFGKNLELRAAISYDKSDLAFTAVDLKGLSPLSVGLKINLWGEKGWIPEAAFLGHITLPWIGERAFRPGFIAPDFRFAFSNTLSEKFSLGYNVGLEWSGDVAASNGIYAIAFGAELLTGLSTFVEVYGFIPEIGFSRHYVDAGFTYLLLPDLQLDVSGGTNIDDLPDVSFLSFGLSWRIPRLF